ncbi:P-loop containing nucleoside triphosphate hydrolase protein, partial [Auriscalpium vulgare]
DVLHKLQFSSTDYVNISLSNDRPNVTQIVRAIEHPISSFIDLDFVVPHSVNNITAIPKTFLYTDDIKGGASIVDYLNARVPPKFRDLGLIRPYNAAMSQKYRKDAMRLFHAGIIRVLVCTDAAGMGCNIADIDVVVQWKTPPTLSAWVQRAGRAARGPGRQGLAIMLVERSAFEVDPSNIAHTVFLHHLRMKGSTMHAARVTIRMDVGMRADADVGTHADADVGAGTVAVVGGEDAEEW